MQEPFEEETLARLRRGNEEMRAQIRRVIVGQNKVVEMLVISLLCGSHSLITGAPGLAKTLLIRTIAQILDLPFRRIQFTPDLMPADITGTEIIDEDRVGGHRQLRFMPGPVFTHVLLADEINRTPPKTQAALLEAMEEKQVTVAGQTRPLQEPFYVFATQNPIELEGTYPLPEAQLDRFMFKVKVDYPSLEEEREILRRTTANESNEIDHVLDAEELIGLQKAIREMPVANEVFDFVLALARGTRVRSGEPLPFVEQYVTWGAGPRAGQNLILGAKAHAAIHGRNHVASEDVRAVAHPVLRHRIVTSFAAQAEGITSDMVIDRLLEEVQLGAGVGVGLPGLKADN